MRKYAVLLLTLVLSSFVAGCGGNSNIGATTLPAITTVAFTAAEVEGKTLYSTTSSGIVAYTLVKDATNSANWNNTPATATTDPITSDTNGTWNVLPDGSLVLTSATGGVVNRFTRIQKENAALLGEYWLVFDNSNKISRFYLDLPTARGYKPSLMGGAVQGGAISAKASFANYSVSTFAGTASTAGVTDGIGDAARFNHPTGITSDGTYLYVADYLNNTIRRIDNTTKDVTTLSFTDGTNRVGFNRPTDITTDGINLYVVDSWNHCIRKIDIATQKVVATIGSTSALSGTVDSTVPSEVRFNTPTGITTDGTNLYVTDSGNHTIRKIVISSNAVSTLAGSAGNSGSADSTIGPNARFYLPARLTTDGSYLYVTDLNNRTIRKISIATGAVTTIAGRAGILGSTDSAASGADARFNQPNGITTDGTNLYVTDAYNNTVSKIVIPSGTAIFSGAVTMIVSGTSTKPGHTDTAPGVAASFDTPVGVTTDGTSLFVVDSMNNTIRKVR